MDDKNPAKGIVVMFIATQCPVSNDYNSRMEALNQAYSKKGIQFIGVNSNKQEPVKEIVEHSKQWKFTFPVLKDVDNKIADVFGARVTPEIYLLEVQKSDKGPKFILRYHGAIDDSQNASKVQTKYTEAALDAFLAGKPIAKAESKAFGCTIKRIEKAKGGKPSATP
jgi:glutathione peroxidase-family protein